jgi:hypothetical protein
MRTNHASLVVAVALCLAGPGCFSPDNPVCAYQCTADNNYDCPENYTCNKSDGYCHLNGSTGACPFPMQDQSMAPDGAIDFAPAMDMAGADMAGADQSMPDMTMSSDDGGDMSVVDMTVIDMAMPDLTMFDFSAVADMTALADAVVVPDQTAVADLTVVPDFTVLVDMVCNPANCTSPPPNTCSGNVLTMYPNPGVCAASACSYPPTTVMCANGCFGGACTGAFSSLGSTAAKLASDGSTVALDTTSSNGTSNMGGPAPHTSAVVVQTVTAPGGTVQQVVLNWSLDPTFAVGVNAVPMSSSNLTMAQETWSGTIPAQAMGVEVYFYIQATPYSGSPAYDPSGFGIHFAYAVN